MPDKKKWCKHMVPVVWENDTPFYKFQYGKGEPEWLNATHYRFKFCPKCGAEAPKAEKRVKNVRPPKRAKKACYGCRSNRRDKDLVAHKRFPGKGLCMNMIGDAVTSCIIKAYDRRWPEAGKKRKARAR